MNGVQANPTEGPGDRHTECAAYRECLNLSICESWEKWNCEVCPLYPGKGKAMSACGTLKVEGLASNCPTTSVPLCRDCGKRPAMMNSRTGKPVNGRCGYCHSKIMHAAKERQNPKGTEEKKVVEETHEKICKRCGKTVKGTVADIQEVFRRNSHAKDGFENVCKECREEGGWSGKQEQEKHRLTIDFKGHEDVLEALKETAKADYRKPEAQAAWLIEKTLEERGKLGEVDEQEAA